MHALWLFWAPLACGPSETAPSEAGAPYEIVVVGAPEGLDPAAVAAWASAGLGAVSALRGRALRVSRVLLVADGERAPPQAPSDALRIAVGPDPDRGALGRQIVHEALRVDGRMRAVGPSGAPAPWVHEGLARYYDALLAARAGLLDEAELLRILSGKIREIEATPGGRALWALPDCGDCDRAAIVGWLLDATIRRASDGRRSLDDAVRALEARCAEQPCAPDEVRAAFRQVGGPPIDAALDRWVDGADALDYGGALQWFGLRWAEPFEARTLEPDPGASPIAVRHRARWLAGTELTLPGSTPVPDPG